ncbi:MAG: PAS domain-containing protein [Gemmatimonadetes bacterium]|nr:PAS domain-containing protein [Gemmatimonadota bacterium]
MTEASQHWLLEACEHGVLLLNRECQVEYINPAAERLLGVRRDDVTGGLLGRHLPAPPAEWLEAYRAALASGTWLGQPSTNGRVFDGHVHPGPEGGIGVIFCDATERHRTEEELIRRNAELEAARTHLKANVVELSEATQAKDRFLAVVSHEMRTPLNAILGYADLLDMGLGGDLSEVQQAHVERIRAGGTHLLELINDVLDLTRADARKLEVELRPVDVEAAIEEVVALLESQAAAKGIALRAEPCGAEIPRVQADLRRLRQVLTNLVGNAIKFTETGAVVLRCTASNDGTVQIAVADTGIGIAPEMLPMIFGEFYQVEGNLTRSYGGSGLGLPIAQRLARLMGGDVLVQSALGQGSTFTLVLPAAAEGSEVRTEDVLLHELRMEAHENAAHTATATPAVVVAFGEREDTLHALGSKVHPNVRIVGTTDASQVPELDRGGAAVPGPNRRKGAAKG